MKGSTLVVVALTFFMSLLVSCSTSNSHRPPSKTADVRAPSADTILMHVGQTYASLKSYSDSGVVYTYRNGLREDSSLAFEIDYLRPDHLLFRMTSNIGLPHFPQDCKALWSDGHSSFTWWQSSPGTQQMPNVTIAVSAFTGISLRSVHNIPSLLQTNFCWQEHLEQLLLPRLLREEVFEGSKCYLIHGGGKGGRSFQLWIDTSDYLIRKILTTYSDFSTEEIHRQIRLNEPIPVETFHFTPPTPLEALTNP